MWDAFDDALGKLWPNRPWAPLPGGASHLVSKKRSGAPAAGPSASEENEPRKTPAKPPKWEDRGGSRWEHSPKPQPRSSPAGTRGRRVGPRFALGNRLLYAGQHAPCKPPRDPRAH